MSAETAAPVSACVETPVTANSSWQCEQHRRLRVCVGWVGIAVFGLSAALGCSQNSGSSTAQSPPRSQPGQTATTKSGTSQVAEGSARSKRNQKSPARPLPPTVSLETAATQSQPPVSRPNLRPSDRRREPDPAKLEPVGIRKYESTRLILYTDIDPELAADLPALTDQLHKALTDYFGALPPDKVRSEFQMTGYLMKSEEAFRSAGLLPADLPDFHHGRHRGNEFWLRDQPYDYYRRHLLLHEATHVWMTFREEFDAPVWYLEGMAELFATHALDAAGRAEFGIIPLSASASQGFGRIGLIQQAFREGRASRIGTVISLAPEAYLHNEAYAWSWGLCTFLAQHPQYRAGFRALSKDFRTDQFQIGFTNQFEPAIVRLETEWESFIANLCYGYHAPAAAILWTTDRALPATGTHSVQVQANRGWQSAGLTVDPQTTYRIRTGGEVSLSQPAQQWTSTASGISFDYAGGRPIGTLLICVLPEPVSPSETDAGPIERTLDNPGEIPAFSPATAVTTDLWHPPHRGTVWFRVNDHWHSLNENTGAFEVLIEPATPE